MSEIIEHGTITDIFAEIDSDQIKVENLMEVKTDEHGNFNLVSLTDDIIRQAKTLSAINIDPSSDQLKVKAQIQGYYRADFVEAIEKIAKESDIHDHADYDGICSLYMSLGKQMGHCPSVAQKGENSALYSRLTLALPAKLLHQLKSQTKPNLPPALESLKEAFPQIKVVGCDDLVINGNNYAMLLCNDNALGRAGYCVKHTDPSTGHCVAGLIIVHPRQIMVMQSI